MFKNKLYLHSQAAPVITTDKKNHNVRKLNILKTNTQRS